MENFWQTFRKTLRRERERAGLTQADMAAKLGISRPTYTYYETGRTHPDLKSVVRIAEILGVALDVFTNIEHEPAE